MMRYESPLRKRLEAWTEPAPANADGVRASAERPGAATGYRRPGPDVEFIPYGPADEHGEIACAVPAMFTSGEVEYATIRRGVGLLDSPHRGTILVEGADRLDFLDRMLTQEIRSLPPGRTTASFWLNRKGRIIADLLLIELDDRLLIDVDIHQTTAAIESLNAFLFSEDVTITDVSDRFHRIAVHGPRTMDLFLSVTGEAQPVELGKARAAVVAGKSVTVVRRDQTGEPGVEIIVSRDDAEAVWDDLLETEERSDVGNPLRLRPIGWFAYNTARIEAGTPLFNIDFGPTNLPHETGLVDQRVSFTKGCYVGQEVVARIQNLGQPKQRLVGLRLEKDLLPVADAPVHERTEGGQGDPLGVITSSTLSPMLGAAPIAFGMLRTDRAQLGSTVVVPAEGSIVEARIVPLRFWPPDDASVGG